MFTQLHVHTTYSLLDGLPKIKDLVAYTKELGMKAVAITDHGNMYGIIEFYQECEKQNIKPIIGSEFYIAEDINIKKPKEKRNHLILLAKNEIGYKNLIKLTSIANNEGMYYKPRIDFNLLKKYHEGLIACSACIMGQIPDAIKNRENKKAEVYIKKYKNLFKEDFYFEIQHHPNIEGQERVNQELLKIGKKENIKCIGTCDSHYLRKEDNEAQDILLCIQTKRKIYEKNRMSMMNVDVSFKSEKEMLEIEIFKNNPELLSNTQEIVDKCNLKLEFGNYKLPYYKIEKGSTEEDEIRKIAKKFCIKKYKIEYDKAPNEIKERFEYELSIIKKMGFESYFLIVQDYINWAKENNIAVGPGRGSGAGSIIAYLLNITDVDPLKYNLLFERFLNPDRISMPDFDIDFSDTRREEVLQYVTKKYGEDHVAQIITFGTMASRAAVKDVGRVLDIPYEFCDILSKSIPQGVSIENALETSLEFKEMYENNKDAKKIINIAKKIEGGCRNSSIHACGILITKDPLHETVPTQRDERSSLLVSQYSGHPAEDLGLLKMDFLGLANLSILEKAVKIVEKVHNIKINLDELKPPEKGQGQKEEEKKTFKLFQDARTTGVFQLESAGMKRYLKELRPTNFEDIIAMVALYRPGPMDFIPHFIDRKHGKEEVEYEHPLMKKALKNTYGITIYQEQVMQLSKDLADFSGGESDGLRKAIGKKIPELMAKFKNRFIEGGEQKGIEKKILKKIWKSWEKFASYCFNRSHAASYATISYQTAYIKANYPACFMAGLMISDSDDLDRIAIETKDARKMGINILPPDINESLKDFTVVTKKEKNSKNYDIRFGLSAIKNVGEGVILEIIEERKKNGKFKNIEDFLKRLHSRNTNKKSLESLIKAGAFDNLENRSKLIINSENLLNYSKIIKDNENSNQTNIFGIMQNTKEIPPLILEKNEEINSIQILKWEKEMLGLYISHHPFEKIKEQLKDNVILLPKIKKTKKKYNIKIAGIISSLKKISTKSNEIMAFITIEDDIGNNVEIIIFPRVYKEYYEILEIDNIIFAIGNISERDGSKQLIANNIYKITEYNIDEILLETSKIKENIIKNKNITENKGEKIKILNIPIPENIKKENIIKLKNFLKENNNGNYNVIFVINENNQKHKLNTPYKINPTKEIQEKIKNILLNS